MTVLKLGIDNGNFNTKSSKRMLYASGFTRSDREFIMDDMQLFYDGAYYAVGGKRMSFQQDKTREDDTFILSLPAIADAMKRAGVLSAEILLGVGLPVDIFGTQKEAFRKYFLRGNISSGFEGTMYRCFITDCKVFAQGHSALCKYYSQLKGYNNLTLVDIGGYTVDILIFHDFKVDRGSCASLRMRTITLFNAIRAELQQENIKLSDTHITDAMNGCLQHSDVERIQIIVERCIQHYLRELLNALREQRYLTFDMNNPRHMEALRLFSNQPDKMRSECVIDCILKAHQENRMEEIIRQTILKAMAGISLHVSAISDIPSKPQSTENISDLPAALVDSIDDI